ncbi:hypothetical protein N878_27830 [Pseudomonas sp. EGD-AK9]|nr:hypothetical protein N878_27830 [Pseudomonas sp. EGD-AK9]
MTLVCVFASAPNGVGELEKIFDFVFNSTWTSSPITVSKFNSFHPLQFRFCFMMVCRLFKCMSNAVYSAFIKVFSDDLQAERKTVC